MLIQSGLNPSLVDFGGSVYYIIKSFLLNSTLRKLNFLRNICGVFRRTALHYAAFSGIVGAVSMLIHMGAVPDVQDNEVNK